MSKIERFRYSIVKTKQNNPSEQGKIGRSSTERRKA